jgi:hypothetical protein
MTDREPSYTVREAVLVRTDAGSAWTVRFAVTGDDDDEVIVVIAPEQLGEMTFARRYSLTEIRDLEDRPVRLADEPPDEG